MGHVDIRTDPEGYAQYILAHSQRSHEQHLWSGVNYRQLAQFFRPRNPLSRSNSHTELFSFAVTHALSVDGGRSIEEFDGEHGHTELSTWLGRQGSSLSLIFLRGYPSANWLKTVGAHCRVDPEFFRRHLDFNSPQEFYDLPALPSTARNIIKLRVTTVFRRTSLLDDKTIDKLRAEEEDHVREHQKQLNRVGESIVRKFSIHDKSYFSIEQNISICVCRRVDKGWQGKLTLAYVQSLVLTSHSNHLDGYRQRPEQVASWSLAQGQAIRVAIAISLRDMRAYPISPHHGSGTT